MPALTYLELQGFLSGRGFDLCEGLSTLDYKAAVERAERLFQERTGWTPFLIGGSETKTFDQMTGDPIWLPVAIQTITALKVNRCEWSVDNIASRLRRRRHDHPYSGIDLGRAITRPISIEITGTFGFAADYSASDKVAIFSKAAYDLYPTLTGQEGDIVRDKQGPDEIEYARAAGDPYSGRRGALLRAFDEAVEDRLRITL